MLFYLRGVGKLETTDRKPSGEKQEVSLPSISEVSESQPGGENHSVRTSLRGLLNNSDKKKKNRNITFAFRMKINTIWFANRGGTSVYLQSQ